MLYIYRERYRDRDCYSRSVGFMCDFSENPSTQVQQDGIMLISSEDSEGALPGYHALINYCLYQFISLRNFFWWGGLCRDTRRGEGGRWRGWTASKLFPSLLSLVALIFKNYGTSEILTVTSLERWESFNFKVLILAGTQWTLTIWKLDLLGWNWIGAYCVEPCSQGESSCAQVWAQVCLSLAWDSFGHHYYIYFSLSFNTSLCKYIIVYTYIYTDR